MDLQDIKEQLKFPFVDLKTFEVDPFLVRLLPEVISRRFNAVVLKKSSKAYLVGLVDPFDIHAFDEISQILFDQPVELAIVNQDDARRILDLSYSRQDEISNLAGQLSEQLAGFKLNTSNSQTEQNQLEAPIAKLIQSIFKDAVQLQATDIHIQPEENFLRIRKRVDGVLHEQIMREKEIINPLIQKLKLMAGLNIAEKRIPQDGSFSIKIAGNNFEVRLSSMPTIFGETVVMRILPMSTQILELEDLGMAKLSLIHLLKIIQNPHGLILVTGPTGSGKTTTLYSIVKRLNLSENKIITVEDPVEYRIERVTQIQVNHQIGLDFAKVLRSALRQDPDILLIGEIRDSETANIALKAAITGHLVLATLHTNDALTSILRLVDLGAEPYLVASALRAVISQRLVRLICENCKISQPMDSFDKYFQQQIWFEQILSEYNLAISKPVFSLGAGCQQCRGSGYRGRIAVFEQFIPDLTIFDALRTGDFHGFREILLKRNDYVPITKSIIDLVIDGKTTIAQAQKILGWDNLHA